MASFLPVLLAAASLAQAAAAPPQAQTPTDTAHQAVTTAYVPQRVYDTRKKAFTDFETMLADLARADVVFVGEQHDDPYTHRLEAAVLQGLMRRKVALTVSLEMFERDVQPSVDAYLAGKMTEEEFLKTSRPWPQYATDYRSLVEMAKGHGWPVIAANVPRRLASDVAKGGQSAIDQFSATDKTYAARELQCPKDAYFTRFAESMGSHPGSDADKQKTLERYYLSQCLKDETMAEAIATAFGKQTSPGTIVHFTGAFHVDYGTGTAERTRRRLAGRRVAIVSMVPVEDLDSLTVDEDDAKRADYLVFTIGVK
jgi:uncharacterized iron-regulated protein